MAQPTGGGLTRREIRRWLAETDPAALAELWRAADAVRRAQVGDEVHLRGLIEISNHCRRDCTYCGLHRSNREVERYRLGADEILACAREAVRLGYGTVVLQAGEDPGQKVEWVAGVVRAIRAETPLAVTLSLGERDAEAFRIWREAGADRYLLRFETSNGRLYRSLHPDLPGVLSDRLNDLQILRNLGYEVGGGIMVGIPGQGWEDLAGDIQLFRGLDLDMIGIGPYLPHPRTRLGRGAVSLPAARGGQVPADELTVLKTVALARLVCPDANIPSTTALATINPEAGREKGLQRGANIVMPNLSPAGVRAKYEIYPGKACVHETAAASDRCIKDRIRGMGRIIGSGSGISPNWKWRHGFLP